MIAGSKEGGSLCNFKHKIRFESEYLLRMRKETTANCDVLNVDKYHKIQKNILMFLLINWLINACNNFVLFLLPAYSLITSPHDNNFVV